MPSMCASVACRVVSTCAARRVVQAQLMTSHMLFVGFSGTDDNYQRLLQSVVEALSLSAADDAASVADAACARSI